jgi:hypothetical protein
VKALSSLLVSCLALACNNLSVEGAHADEEGLEHTTGVIGEGTTSAATACGEIHDEDECIEAGCAPTVTRPVVHGQGTDAATCEFGESIVVCTPPEETLECEVARVCGDDRSAWAMPMPDGGALVALVELSCGLPRGFLPCPEPDASAVGTETGGSPTSSDGEGGESDDPLALACACACS